MNKVILVLAVVLSGWISNASAELPGKVQILAQKKRDATVKENVGKRGSTAHSKDMQNYEITIQNRTQGDLTNLTLDYIVFVERQKLGEKKGSETFERVTGTKKIDTLGRQPLVMGTDAVSLATENLVGTYHYKNGGRIRAEDSLVGVWVRISQDGKLIGEYALPTTAMNRGWGTK